MLSVFASTEYKTSLFISHSNNSWRILLYIYLTPELFRMWQDQSTHLHFQEWNILWKHTNALQFTKYNYFFLNERKIQKKKKKSAVFLFIVRFLTFLIFCSLRLTAAKIIPRRVSCFPFHRMYVKFYPKNLCAWLIKTYVQILYKEWKKNNLIEKNSVTLY